MIGRKLKEQKGAAAVEFGLILPILTMLLLGIAQFGILFNNYVTITHAAREGVRWAALEEPVSAVKSKTIAAAPGLKTSDLTIVVKVDGIVLADSDRADITDQKKPAEVEVSYPAPVFSFFKPVFNGNDTVTLTGRATQMIE